MSEEVEIVPEDRARALALLGLEGLTSISAVHLRELLRLEEAFARHRLAERERCAKVAEECRHPLGPSVTVDGWRRDIANAIRAEGQP